MHGGQTPGGNNFATFYKDYKVFVDAPFQRFAGAVFRTHAQSLTHFLTLLFL